MNIVRIIIIIKILKGLINYILERIIIIRIIIITMFFNNNNPDDY